MNGMDTFSLSPDCQHSKNGLCSKCILNQTFSISKAEERHRRNHSNGSVISTSSSSSTPLYATNQPSILRVDVNYSTDYTSFPSLPVPLKAVQPQKTQEESIFKEEEYTSFADLNKFSSIKIQEENNKNPEYVVTTHPLVEPSSWLMRLFESSMFSASIAMQYLFSSNERGVRTYLGSRLFTFLDAEIDFFIPQLINMYIHSKEVASAVHPYIVRRCQSSVHFSLICVWLLESFAVDRLQVKDKTMGHGEMLRQMILNEFRAPKSMLSLNRTCELNDRTNVTHKGAVLSPENLNSGLHLTRSESAASSLRYLSPRALSNGTSLDTGCHCLDETQLDVCKCGAERLVAEKEFVAWLSRIGDRLKEEPSKGEKTRRLVSELLVLNMHLPSRVWIPLSNDHIVLRIPPSNSCVLNSKDKAPYCIYVEVLRCDDVMRVRIPKSVTEVDCDFQFRSHSPPIASCDSAFFKPTLTAKTDKCKSSDNQIPVVECKDVEDTETIFPDVGILPDLAWDTMSMESSSSEPAMRGHGLINGQLSRRLKQWVKRPGRRRQMRSHPDDPSASNMSEPWDEKIERMRKTSPYGELSNWDLIPVIVKSGDDLAQELVAYQLLVTLKDIWNEEGVPLFLRPYKILVTSSDSGMIEAVVDACSLHQIKRNQCAVFRDEGRTETPSLEAHFIDSFGPKGAGTYIRAQTNFVQSCAAYSLACYFLQVKDRHNGNILIDSEGHLIHIDFGFILSISPKNIGFETSPFKLTTELINVMGGIESDLFLLFKSLLLRGLIAARKHHERIMTIVEIMSRGSHLACFRGGATALRAMKDRFHITYTDQQLEQLVDSMVEQSRDSLTTRLYDNFQYYTNGIL